MRRSLAPLAAAFLLLVAAPAGAATCAFPNAARVLHEEGDPHAKGSRLLQVWEVRDHRVWWSTADPAGYGDFRARVRRHAGETDPLRLLQQVPSKNNQVVAENAKAWIRPANCLEKLLQQAQDRRIDTFRDPTEFAAFVLRSPDGKTLRIYSYTVNQDGIGRVKPLADPVTADRRAGWTVLGGLHNHNFHPGQPLLNAPLAPSGPDAQFNLNFAREVGMAEAWITNGLHTVRIPAAAFHLFDQSGP